jgi:hypothetical protein
MRRIVIICSVVLVITGCVIVLHNLGVPPCEDVAPTNQPPKGAVDDNDRLDVPKKQERFERMKEIIAILKKNPDLPMKDAQKLSHELLLLAREIPMGDPILAFRDRESDGEDTPEH